jgi:hypothetical protein
VLAVPDTDGALGGAEARRDEHPADGAVSYRRRGGGGKRDTAEGPIVDALRACGVGVWFLSGQGNPDLLTHYRGLWLPLEVKTGKGTLTPNQVGILWPVTRTVDQALAVLGICG